MNQTSIETHKPPSRMPFCGTVPRALLSCALDRTTEILDYFPDHPDAASAKLWLRMAVELAEARERIVHSIEWKAAPVKTRYEVAAELERLGRLVIKYVKKFGYHWNRVVESVEDFEEFLRSLPVPDYRKGECEWIYHDVKISELGYSIYSLTHIDQDFNQKLLTPRKRRWNPKP